MKDINYRNIFRPVLLLAALICMAAVPARVYASAPEQTVLEGEAAASQEADTKPVIEEKASLSCTTDGSNVNITASVSGPAPDSAVFDLRL